MEKPRVTEIKVRIDCNGCVQKIKKALHGINGINDIFINVPQQKLTIIGWADPEKIVKAIKKTRKLAIIFSETQPSPPSEPPLEGCGSPSDPSDPPPTETVPSPEPSEPPKEPENTPEPAPAPPAQEPPSTPRQSPHTSGPKETHAVHHYPPDQGHRQSHERVSSEHYSSSHSPVYKHEPPQSVHVMHSYNTYKPTTYVTDYKYIRSPPQYTHYSRHEPPHYNTLEPPPEQTNGTRSKPPPQRTHYTRPEPPQHDTHYNRPEPPPQQTHYTRPEPPQNYTHYSKPEPPLQYTHYHRPKPSLQYTEYDRPEPPQPYTNYGLAELPPHDTNYSGEYHSYSNENGNITSIFSDENPNACTIV